MKHISVVVIVGLALSGCEEGYVSFPVTEQAQEEIVGEQQIEIIRLSSQNIAQFGQPERTAETNFVPHSQVWNYKVGAGDILAITVFEHPELQLPATGGNEQGSTGFQVQANGTFHYPYVGEITASGRTPELIREDLTARLAEYIPDPQVQVRVSGYNSQSIIVSGKVSTPNSQPLASTPLTVLTAINAAGGFAERADRSRVKLQRSGKTYNINLDLFLAGSGKRHNPILISGDVISVPEKTLREAYVLGQVSKPAPVDLTEESVNLTQAITRLGGLDEKRADARGVFVFRKQGAEGKIKVFQLETSSPTGMLLGTEFQLVANDIVYVTRAPISKWNDVITQLLPSIGVSARIDDLVDS